ncbi:polyhydroxyalkanoate synthesis regulator DNA-binding domain-containing protein [Roseomonas chloroacetimidivorans]|uniref:polyhydroxyalkanoate synthesis regulator DNA-binding domain-containing protein n=1 Tax=Roseomonas chloroacetimidivorans TaxID=1766656 RepID=UPI003C766FE0
MTPGQSKSAPIVIRRYAADRFYNMAERRYVSVHTLRSWDAQEISFRVIDAETKEDITSTVLS